MKPVFAIINTLLIGSSLSGFCQSGRDVGIDHQTFADVTPVEVENILTFDPVTQSMDPVIEPLPVELPDVRIMSMNDEDFIDLRLTPCLISFTGDNTLRITHDDAFDFHVESGFPHQLVSGVAQTGLVSLRSYNTAAGADEKLRLFLGDTLVLGYLWQTHHLPLDINDHTDQPLIRQLPQQSSLPDETSEVQVQVMDDTGPKNAPTGEYVTFTNRGIRYRAFVMISAYIPLLDEVPQDNGGYLFRAVIMRD